VVQGYFWQSTKTDRPAESAAILFLTNNLCYCLVGNIYKLVMLVISYGRFDIN
jgi:hypothetical protein